MSLSATAASSDYQYLLAIDITPLHIDWKILIQDIRNKSMPYYRQAEALGVQWSTFQNWFYNGSQPIFQNGHALLILHTKVCGTRLTEQRFIEFMEKRKDEI